MCRNKSYTPEKKEHDTRWQLDKETGNYFKDEYMQVAATSGLPIIMKDTVTQQNVSMNAHWGLVPWFSKTPEEGLKSSFKYVNARAETVHDSKLYAPLLKQKKRCLIPCTCYFEHHHFNGGTTKVPFAVKTDKEHIFSIPGLYTVLWKDKNREEGLISYTMFTIVANDLLAAIHNGGENSHRMPLVITRDMEAYWLNPDTPDKVIDEILNYQVGSKTLDAWAVSPLTGKKAKQGKEILERADWGIYNKEIEDILKLAA
jgi:putative SOS response-associated peptidase YedK